MRIEHLYVDASADARNCGDVPTLKVADCRPMASGESMRVGRLDIEMGVDRQLCVAARKSGDAR